MILINVIGTLFSLIIVLIKAPIIHINKSVNDIERRNYMVGVSSVTNITNE